MVLDVESVEKLELSLKKHGLGCGKCGKAATLIEKAWFWRWQVLGKLELSLKKPGFGGGKWEK